MLFHVRMTVKLPADMPAERAAQLKADEKEAAEEDGKNTLWRTNPDQCCDLRKVRPLNKVMETYGAWISGRKRHQSKTRTNLAIVEWDGRHFKVNPLAKWGQADLDAYRREVAGIVKFWARSQRLDAVGM